MHYIGYDEHNTATIAAQDANMIARGCNINLISFYGSTNQSSDILFDLKTTNLVFGDLSSRTNFPLKFGVLEDVGAFQGACSGQGESQTISCIESNLEKDMDYINANYTNSKLPQVYWQDHGQYVIGYFGACADFSSLTCPSDWSTIWTAVQNYVNGSPRNYNFKFIFEYGHFDTPTISAGEYAWPQPYTSGNNGFQLNPQSQFWWCDPNGVICTGSSSAYLDSFYQQAENNTSQVIVGLLYSGFDDSNASWGKDRVIAQQCGQVLLDTAGEVSKSGFWGSGATQTQIPYMMIATWNDYEEGSEEESGVDNCYTAVNTSLSGTTMNWTLTVASGQQSYATINTIHHYALWTAPHGGSTLTLRAQLVHTAASYNLASLKLSPGTYDVYLEMIGQPMIQNELSSALVYTQH